jgi:Protein of unknown function (DUF1579)
LYFVKKIINMKHLTIALCASSILLFSCNNSGEKTETAKTDSTSTEVKKTDEAWVPVDSATMMNAMITYGTPGKMHEMMASWNGTWTGETTMWDYEGAAPKTSAGTAVNSMTMGGKYQMSKHTGNMDGMPFEGLAIMGYDNSSKQFVSSWIDTWSTGIMNMTGTWDEATKTLTSTGTMPDICRPGKQCTLREVYTVVDENTHNFVMYGPDQKTGKEYKMMEIKMTRKK